MIYSGDVLWPWQSFYSRRQIITFITSNLCIPLENTLGRSAVMSCEGELLLLCKIEFSLVFPLELCVQLPLRLVVNRTLNKWCLVESNMLLEGSVCFLCKLCLKGRDTHTAKTKALLLSNDQQLCLYVNIAFSWYLLS